MMEVQQNTIEPIEEASKENVNIIPKLGEVPVIENKQDDSENPAGYLCRETGEILDAPEEIAYYKVEQNEQIIENLLLGEFDADGKYVIDKPFLEELVKVRKVIREQFDDKYILTSKLSEFGELKFTMQVLNAENGKKVAILKFIEMSFNFDEDREVFRTYVASYKDDNDLFFMQKVFKVFNIVRQEDYDGLDIDPEELLLILKRFKLLAMLRAKRIEGVDYISNVYVDEVLAILKKYPCKFSAYILRKYYGFLKEMAMFAGSPKYFMKLRKFLDKIINSSKHEIPKDLMEEIKKSREGYAKNYKNVVEPIMEPVVAPKKEAKKVETKSSGGSSGGTKKGKVKSKKKASGAKKAKPAKKNGKTLGLDTLHLTHPYRREQKPEEKKVEKKPLEKSNKAEQYFQRLARNTVEIIKKKSLTRGAELHIQEASENLKSIEIPEKTTNELQL